MPTPPHPPKKKKEKKKCRMLLLKKKDSFVRLKNSKAIKVNMISFHRFPSLLSFLPFIRVIK